LKCLKDSAGAKKREKKGPFQTLTGREGETHPRPRLPASPDVTGREVRKKEKMGFKEGKLTLGALTNL